MRVVLQRATHGRCTVMDETGEPMITGEIGKGLVLLVGVGPNDTNAEAEALARKIARLRIFSDEAGKMNHSILDISAANAAGQVLSISQFTLYADTKRGNRPGFSRAAPPEQARKLYQVFNAALRAEGLGVQEGVFAADMQIDLCNDGPVTLVLDTDEWAKS